MAAVQFKRDFDGRFICPYNSECRCTSTNCVSCGWHPEVRIERLRALAAQYGVSSDTLTKLIAAAKTDLRSTNGNNKI